MKKRKQSNKTLTIWAVDRIIYKYLNPQKFDVMEDYFEVRNCPLCEIHRVYYDSIIDCTGCPLANKHGGYGCELFESFRTACEKRTPENFELRAKFFKVLKEKIRDLPESRFTKRGWEYLPLDYNL
jgi:hypothetical protein